MFWGEAGLSGKASTGSESGEYQNNPYTIPMQSWYLLLESNSFAAAQKHAGTVSGSFQVEELSAGTGLRTGQTPSGTERRVDHPLASGQAAIHMPN